ncbi:hypothetical protein HYX18_03155 [Candidatus Woesearchaeota archaeon]|nr:hypothetical protein [Candidatus Woesearchaeota archaeon]
MKTKRANIICNVFLVWILFISILIFKSQEVDAASIHVCEWTYDNNFCVESTDESFRAFRGCREGYKDSFTTIGQVPNCKKGTCVPNGPGGCLSNKYKIACIKGNSGRWFDLPKEQVQDCQLGCCNVANSLCGIKEKKVCIQDIANGNVNAYNGAITSPVECDNSCRSADKGCCKSGDLFKWATRENCKIGEFFAGTQCRNVAGYNAISHKYTSCGDNTEDNDEFDVYWYDSNNNREDVAKKCNYPYQKCFDTDGKGGKEAECISTSCVDECPDCFPGQFRTGESVCLNTLETFYGNEKRSTGLHNYILRCQWGKVETDDTDKDRERLCKETTGVDGRVQAGFRENKFQDCASCGEGSETDIAGFVPVIGPPISAGLLLGLGASCGKNGWDWGIGESCESRGDCKYDSDFIWTPIGSCTPKIPPGTTSRCNECGGGGDKATNLCTKKECNSLGDCQFQGEFTSENLLATGQLALGTCAGGWILAKVACDVLPITCPGPIAAAKTLCTKVGSHTLFWGVIGSFYGFGAAKATEDAQLPDKSLTGEKIPIGVALAFANGLMANLSSDKVVVSDYVARTEKSNILPEASYATLGGLTAASAMGIRRYVIDGTVTLFSKLHVPTGISTFLIQHGFYDGLLKALVLVQVSKSFQTGKCLPEYPLTTNQYCETCGAGEGQWYCTKQRCDILGGATGNCKYFQTPGKNDGRCLSVPKDDVTQPQITRIEAKFLDATKAVLKEYSNNGKSFEIPDKLSWNIVSLELAIKTNEKARCTFSDKKGIEYGIGSGFNEPAYEFDHSTEFNISEADKINGVTFYFKCEDLNGNKIDKTDDSSFVSFKFDKRPDTSPPLIYKIDPRNSILLPADKKSIELSVYATDGVDSDVAECRYTKSNNTNYNEFEDIFKRGNKIECLSTANKDCREFTTNLELTSDWGTDFTIDNNRSATLFRMNINCKDDDGNIGFEPQPWTMITTETFKIFINDPKEDEQLYNRRPLINVTTSAATICNYTISGKEFGLNDEYDFEHAIYHEENLPEGQHNLKVSCNDIAGNELFEERNFQVIIDNNLPKIIRLYKSLGKLCIQLDENAECRYSYKSIFPAGWDDGARMVEGNLVNSYCATLNQDKVYYIDCRDTWGNEITATIYP